MKTSQALIAALTLGLAMGAAPARAQANPHDHGDKPQATAAEKPATHDGATTAPAAHAGGAGMMGCGAMMHGGGAMMHGGDAMMHGGGAMKHDDGAMRHDAMRCCEGMKMPMGGEVDKDFVAMMIMHHRQAIRMADIQIAHGKDETLKAMARKMREDQLAEIARLEKHR